MPQEQSREVGELRAARPAWAMSTAPKTPVQAAKSPESVCAVVSFPRRSQADFDRRGRPAALARRRPTAATVTVVSNWDAGLGK
jgi:hypothetical protein